MHWEPDHICISGVEKVVWKTKREKIQFHKKNIYHSKDEKQHHIQTLNAHTHTGTQNEKQPVFTSFQLMQNGTVHLLNCSVTGKWLMLNFDKNDTQ